METAQKIRLSYPLPIAKLYESMSLEVEPRQRVRKQVELFERTVQYLALVGLALYNEHALSDPKVESSRSGLGLPSLGHWVALLKVLSQALRPQEPTFLTPEPGKVYKDDALSGATETLAQSLGQAPPKKVLLHHFLDQMVEFRNKKIGHGVLSLAEAKQVVQPLDAALAQWLEELPLLQERALIHVAQVDWQATRFVYLGANLNSGTSRTPFKFERESAITPNAVYLHDPAQQSFIPLHPFFYYDPDRDLLYLYSELAAQGSPLLRCPYEAPGAELTYTLDLDSTCILGTGITVPTRTPAHPKGEAPPAPPISTQKDIALMKSWFDIIPPHEDIRKGHFDEAVFAADLGDVAAGTAHMDYRDPYLFYQKTYLTQGLQNLLARVGRKLSRGESAGVVEIQTPFGGGKTHAMVAIYHYLKHGSQIRELLPAGLEILDPEICVIAGNHWNALGGNTTDGITRHTFWGELGYQIGGREGYEFFRENDEQHVSPGKKDLRTFLEGHQPFMLLFDEILEYINRALAVGGEQSSLGTQTFSFFQELTEAVSNLPRGMMVVTLPSSYLEDFGEQQEASLARLNKIFGRLESIETPVQGEEVYAVIRRRLFEVEHLKTAEMRQIVYQYFQAYQEHYEDLPAKARDVGYREKMELAYPFHPDVIDILYEKWSTFASFQRTRGVLRLLASIVEDLYNRETNIDLIMPGDLNLDRPEIRQEFLRHVGSEYEGIIGSDIAGHDAKAQMLDAANKSWKHLAQRIATAVFFHSFSADASAQGINLPYIKLAVIRSETIPSLVTDVLQRLANTLWYLNTQGEAYYFSRIPNLNRMILDKRELYNDAYRPKLRQLIEGEIGKEFTAYLWPESDEAISDNRALKLVLLPPEDSGATIPYWIEHHGTSFREYQNTLFFALADTAAFAALREDVKSYLALEEIEGEVKSGRSPLPAEKLSEVQQRKRTLERDFSHKVRKLYHTLRVGRREIDLGQPVIGDETLGHWYRRELASGERGMIVTQLHYRMLVNKFLAGSEQISSAALLNQFYKNLELPVPSEEGVVARAIQLGVKEGALGLVDVRQDGTLVRDTFRYRTDIALSDVTFAPEEMLLSSAQCEALLAQWAAGSVQPPLVEVVEPGTSGSDTGIQPPGNVPGIPHPEPGPTPPVMPTESRYHHLHLVIADVPASKIADVNRGIFMPLSNLVDGLTFTLELDVDSAEGISESTVEAKIKETIRQIGARITKEEKRS